MIDEDFGLAGILQHSSTCFCCLKQKQVHEEKEEKEGEE